MVREESNSDEYFNDFALSTADVDRVGYLNPHIAISAAYDRNVEIWVDGEYQHPDQITWIHKEPYDYAVLTKPYNIVTYPTASVFYNSCILYRYHKIQPENDRGYKHTVTIDISKEPYTMLEYPHRSAYYIADNEVKVPETVWIDDHTIQFSAPYQTNIDFFIVSNLVGIYPAEANKGVYIDSPNSPVCWHHIVVDGDPKYHIDARFYPCIKVDKDCIIRVYNDHYHRIKYPETCRLVNYPEYADVEDPYNTGVEYLRTLKEIDDVIEKKDADPVIYRKFLRIARFCYRIWEKFPIFSDEVSDFIICDNHEFGNPKFKHGKIAGFDQTYDDVIYSVNPYEPHRDLLFYNGELFSDYQVMQLIDTGTSMAESKLNGTWRYVIPGHYDMGQFTLIKFNSWEDTNVFNVGDYINEKLTLDLHTKLNNFYRNLVTIRREFLDRPADDYVRVMTEEPTIKDEYLWFELLVNAKPPELQENTQLIINLYGVNGELIPDKVKNGAYMLDMDPENGPPNYKDLLMTFFDLSESQKKYLALQYEEKERTVGVYYDVTIGDADNPDGRVDGGLVIDDESMSEPYTEGTIDIGDSGSPDDSSDNVPGDLYAEMIGDDGTFDDLMGDIDPDAPVGTMALEELVFMSDDKHITMDEISSYNRESKINFIKSNIATVPEEERAQINEQLTDADDDTLTRICYKILQTEYVYNTAESGSRIGEGVLSEETEDEIYQHNLKYIISEDEPDEKQINDLWIQLEEVDMKHYIKDVVSNTLIESATMKIKNPVYTGDSNPIEATMAFDFGANDTSGVMPELFQAEKDPTLRPVHTGKDEPTDLKTDRDVWYEFLDETVDRVAYYDEETMVVKVNERLMAVNFGHNNITGFLFDDVVLNFRGKLGMKYLSILADLVNAGVVNKDQLVVFYHRLITDKDRFDPDLQRLYTGTSHVIATCKTDTTDLGVIYSTNIGRFTMNYADETTTNREREAAYRMCINYTNRDFAFLTDRMLVFVNGKYIPREHCREEIAQCLQILDFDEVITTVDILYSMKDVELMKIKKAAYAYWPLADDSESIQRPERDYKTMEPINIYEKTKRGYYDVLLDEFIFNGKLNRILNYLEEHPDEAERFKMEIVHQFHAISDSDLAMGGLDEHNPRIIIPGNGFDQIYTIQEEAMDP